MKASNILETIGNTPHVRINRLFPANVEVWMKLERANPGSSIKDRIGLAMIIDAEQQGLINKDTVIIEPTSGNTGIGLAMVAATRGYRLILTMPESMSLERRRYLAALGAELVLTPREKGMGGAMERAKELLAEHMNSWMPAQFSNPANVAIHRRFGVATGLCMAGEKIVDPGASHLACEFCPTCARNVSDPRHASLLPFRHLHRRSSRS
jgi:cysteine synthase A